MSPFNLYQLEYFQNAENAILDYLDFQHFLGEHAPRPPDPPEESTSDTPHSCKPPLHIVGLHCKNI